MFEHFSRTFSSCSLQMWQMFFASDKSCFWFKNSENWVKFLKYGGVLSKARIKNGPISWEETDNRVWWLFTASLAGFLEY